MIKITVDTVGPFVSQMDPMKDMMVFEVKARVPQQIKQSVLKLAEVRTAQGRRASESDIVREALVHFFKKRKAA